MTATTTLGPLTKSVLVLVPGPVDRAFQLFTAEMGRWWPTERYSVGGGGVEMQCRVGGEIVETLPDGGTTVWATVTDWDPPRMVAFTWHPGHRPAEATRVEVGFEESGTQARVTLVHSGWEGRLDADRSRQAYDTGWDEVLARFVGGQPDEPAEG